MYGGITTAVPSRPSFGFGSNMFRLSNSAGEKKTRITYKNTVIGARGAGRRTAKEYWEKIIIDFLREKKIPQCAKPFVLKDHNRKEPIVTADGSFHEKMTVPIM